ncbi:hypothetical protein C3B61_03405 [Cryobacterium zongtaii]|uniref:Uncharacterized protein n=1 Tax=Cryobacterium zongtaii TaxID=1259217 RepID=A0A2S3ZLM3_9MICO|nr:hypothetical protein [Cryobacterium zongtaii]POH68960.1 hypothetical protein C3B61_03405 [Cryobacterium zongtaii]
MYADVVSTIALIAAGGSLGWQIYKETRWDRPQLAVSGVLKYSVDSGFSDGVVVRKPETQTWDLEVVVANVGNVTTQIVDVYWEFERADEAGFRVRGTETVGGPKKFEFNGQVAVHDGDMVEGGSALPRPINRNEVLTWTFERPRLTNAFIDDAVQGRPVVEYVSRAKDPIASETGRNPHIMTAKGEFTILSEFPELGFAAN